MAKRLGFKLLSTVDGQMEWQLGNGSRKVLNTNKLDANVREQAMFAGFHRMLTNIGAGKDKTDWAAIEREWDRRVRGLVAGQWKTNVGGYGFADHVEAIIRIAERAGTPKTYDAVADILLSWTAEQRTEHAAKPVVRLAMQEIATERMRLAVAEDDETGSALADFA